MPNDQLLTFRYLLKISVLDFLNRSIRFGRFQKIERGEQRSTLSFDIVRCTERPSHRVGGQNQPGQRHRFQPGSKRFDRDDDGWDARRF